MVGHLMNSAQVAYYAVCKVLWQRRLWLLIDSQGSMLFPFVELVVGMRRGEKP